MKVPMEELWTEADTEDAVEKDYVPPRKHVERINAIHSDSEEDDNRQSEQSQPPQNTHQRTPTRENHYEEEQS